ncbi:hypothetical protein MLD52_09065 [Puniceicoccaceae bacterium K14]|nr:hypothetical protein [Puniceicoccaceae bacterium K14]
MDTFNYRKNYLVSPNREGLEKFKKNELIEIIETLRGDYRSLDNVLQMERTAHAAEIKERLAVENVYKINMLIKAKEVGLPVDTPIIEELPF